MNAIFWWMLALAFLFDNTERPPKDDEEDDD